MKKVLSVIAVLVVAALVVGTTIEASPAERGEHIMQSLGFTLIVGSVIVIVASVRRKRATAVVDDDPQP